MDYQQVRATLLAKQQELLSRVNKIDKDLHHREEPVAADFSEQVTELENIEVLVALGEEGKEELGKVNRALTRLDNDVYEQCSQCGKDIAPARLQAIPYTELCINCAD